MFHISALKFILVLMFWNQGCVNDSSLHERIIVALWLKVKKKQQFAVVTCMFVCD